MDLRGEKLEDENNVGNTSSPGSIEETQPPNDASNDTNATPPSTPPTRLKHKKKDGRGPKSIPLCRFCNRRFTTFQALGGHMNCHRREREKEEFQKAETLIHTKGQFVLRYPSAGAGPSHYQPKGNYGNPYLVEGPPMANAAYMMGNMGGGLQRYVYQNSNQQQFVQAPQMNPNYGIQAQQMVQVNYESQPQHGGSYINYNQYDINAASRPHVPSGVPQTSYTPRANSGQYQAQGTGSLQEVKPYTPPHGGSSSTRVGHHQSNMGFTVHNLNHATGANTPTLDNIVPIGTSAVSNMANVLCESTAHQAVAQLVNQLGNIVTQGPSSGYSIKLPPLNSSHFSNNIQATEFNQRQSQASYHTGTSVHDTIQVQSDKYDAVGMENQCPTQGVGMLDFKDALQGDVFGIRDLVLNTITVTESGHGGGVSTSNSTK